MATLESIGLSEPTGLPYLIDEGHLPKDPKSNSYTWRQELFVEDNGDVAVEEVLTTEKCVVWSRHGTIKRVYNLNIEGEQLLHAFPSCFKSTRENSVPTSTHTGVQTAGRLEPALVVVLKTQAHIFCLSGPLHIIPLSFEVARVLPSSMGVFLQPKLPEIRESATSDSYNAYDNRPLDTSSKIWSSIQIEASKSESRRLSKVQPTFCITDLLSDIGLVAASYTRLPKDVSDSLLLPADEEILYASNDAHLNHPKFANVCIVVSLNRSTGTFTIWQVQRVRSERDVAKPEVNALERRTRQSSNYHERPRVASNRTADPGRDSFGGLMMSLVDHEPKHGPSQLSNIEHLAAELGQDFDASGVQTRSARRISSMLARTDLAPANERSTYIDPSIHGRKSLSRNLRREGSFGSFTERNSLSARRSFPAGTSIYSHTTSVLNGLPRFSLNEAVDNEAEIRDYGAAYDRFDKSLIFLKLKSLSCHETSKLKPVRNVKVILITHPENISADGNQTIQFSVCIQECLPQLMTVVTITVKGPSHSATQITDTNLREPELKAVQVQRGNSIADACLVQDGNTARLLILSKTLHDDDVLHLEAPWSSSFRITLPDKFKVHSPFDSRKSDATEYVDKVGAHRMIDGTNLKISSLPSTFNNSTFPFRDSLGRSHTLRVGMQILNKLNKRILDVCSYALPASPRDGLLVAYWEVTRWLEDQSTPEFEQTSIAVTLFLMAIPFISSSQNKLASPSRKRKLAGKRLSSSSLTENTVWKAMQAHELIRQSPDSTHNSSWAWLSHGNCESMKSMASPRTASGSGTSGLMGTTLTAWIPNCIDLTVDFLQSPAGESMSGPEGYLPTAINQDRNARRTTLATITVALYLLAEELKLMAPVDESIVNELTMLRILILQMSIWLGWQTWIAKLKRELQAAVPSVESLGLDTAHIDDLETPSEPFVPSSMYEYVESQQLKTPLDYHTLAELVRNTDGLQFDHPLLNQAKILLPQSHRLLDQVQMRLSRERKNGISVGNELLNIVERIWFPYRPAVNVSLTKLVGKEVPQHFSLSHKPLLVPEIANHTATRDTRLIVNQAVDTDSLSRWDSSSENERQVLTKLIFSQDRRFQEAARLVNQARTPEVEYDAQSHWSEADALDAQNLLAQYATKRTFAVVSGRGLMHFSARTPLLTETVPAAQFSMSCSLRPRSDTEMVQPMIVYVDKAQFTEEKVSWAFFHNGASAGLMISKAATFIDTSWILYNKPPELTNRHAGFLLALGLNGHLKSLAKWVAFKYLTPKHTMTSIGLLLGLAASYRGTADTLITRLMSVHVTCLLPPGAAELNLSPLTQVTGLIGVGLLYHDTQHRRMSDVMISEIESQELEEHTSDEPVLKDEGYRLAAGIALGLINLGHGQHLHSLQDARIVDRLLAIAVGPKNVNLVHVLDRATAGAVVAVTLIFMKTNDASVAHKIDIPDTSHQFEYVRPDIFLLRTLARHMIMWDQIRPEQAFVERSLPTQYRHRASLKKVKQLVTNDLAFFHVVAGICFAIALRFAGSQRHDARDLLIRYLDEFMRLARLSSLSYDSKVTLNGIRNCLDILGLSCATVMAGSGDLQVYRRLRALHGRLDKDMPFGSHLAAHMAIGALFLGGGTATFGTSNLAIASLIIAFYPLFPTDVLDNRGHLQALRHLWVLATEHRCLYFRDAEGGQVLGNIEARLEMADGSTQTINTPGLVPNLNEIKVINVENENFWQVRIELDNQLPTDHNGKHASITLREHYSMRNTGITASLTRRPLYNQALGDGFYAELRNLTVGTGTSSTDFSRKSPSTSSVSSIPRGMAWVFNLFTLQSLSHAERELIIHPASVQYHDNMVARQSHSDSLTITPIDMGLELDIGVFGPENVSLKMQCLLKSEKLARVGLLMACATCFDRDTTRSEGGQEELLVQQRAEMGQPSLLNRELIENLRWRLVQMSQL